MAFKSVLGVLLLLCIAATVEAGTYVARINLGSGHLESNGWGHNRRTFYYHVPKDAFHVSLQYHIRRGSGDARLSWHRGSLNAKVYVFAKGSFFGSRIAWTVTGSIWKKSG